MNVGGGVLLKWFISLQGLVVHLWELGRFLKMDRLDLVGMGWSGMNIAGIEVVYGVFKIFKVFHLFLCFFLFYVSR